MPADRAVRVGCRVPGQLRLADEHIWVQESNSNCKRHTFVRIQMELLVVIHTQKKRIRDNNKFEWKVEVGERQVRGEKAYLSAASNCLANSMASAACVSRVMVSALYALIRSNKVVWKAWRGV